ncbi:hypothetical protein [Bacillus wiedmannii]|nr:hypothetical protein [Bacillus wiedmannii]
MSVSVIDELQLFAQEIQVFSPNALLDLARDVSFFNEPVNTKQKI